MAERYRSPMLFSGRVKLFADGVLDSGTAVRVDDYPDAPGWRGEPLFTAEDLTDIIVEIDRRGLQVSVHAIGDGAVRMVLDGVGAARARNGVRDSRHRIEHIELYHPDDLGRFAELDIIASVQPSHLPGGTVFPPEPTRTKIGAARWPHAYAWRALRDAGARLAFSSDWPVAPLPPMVGIQNAVARTQWRDDLAPQSIDLMGSIAAYTCEGAYAGFQEQRVGRIAVGFDADIAVLDADITAVPPEELAAVAVDLTVCRGRITHESGRV